jgi:hypothetical protein
MNGLRDLDLNGRSRREKRNNNSSACVCVFYSAFSGVMHGKRLFVVGIVLESVCI